MRATVPNSPNRKDLMEEENSCFWATMTRGYSSDDVDLLGSMRVERLAWSTCE